MGPIEVVSALGRGVTDQLEISEAGGSDHAGALLISMLDLSFPRSYGFSSLRDFVSIRFNMRTLLERF